jgi:hypothetical protein
MIQQKNWSGFVGVREGRSTRGAKDHAAWFIVPFATAGEVEWCTPQLWVRVVRRAVVLFDQIFGHVQPTLLACVMQRRVTLVIQGLGVPLWRKLTQMLNSANNENSP